MAKVGSGQPGFSGSRRNFSRSGPQRAASLWRPDNPAPPSTERELQQLRQENAQLKRDLEQQRCASARTLLNWQEERRARAEAEAAWRDSFNLFARWFDDSVFGMTCVSPEGVIVQVNRAELEMLGYSRREYIGRPFSDIVVEDDVLEAILAGAAGGELLRDRRAHLRGREGSIRPVLMSCRPFRQGLSHGICCYTQDLAEVEMMLAERRRLEKEVLEISDHSQRRLGQDLHDGLCQHLLGVALMSRTLADRLARKGSEGAEQARMITDFLYEGVGQARGVIKGLHLVNLTAGGLAAAFREFCDTTGKLFNIPCRFETDVELTVTEDDLANQIFRIAQEATNNSIKHGHAKCVTVRLSAEDGGLLVAVEDDGQGLPSKRFRPAGMGMHTMEYRAGLIGAALEFENRPEGGATVRCRLPRRQEIQIRPAAEGPGGPSP